ncbi:hypothetical protein MLD38_027258 [Melastoma candidum]|uniref:Uncharacterized protein n=2 Tax=Melastoma candidum TaxID=119954 RepID=A0ACB9P2J4_9MYRT|nr:hypothetical protein MLD38_027258 [Melastoma candidum]
MLRDTLFSVFVLLVQDSFEDDKLKILMIICASPDPKELHKTISTLEYGAKAKCIGHSQHTPMKEKLGVDDSSVAEILVTRIEAMDQFIHNLQVENKIREKERNEAHKEVLKKEQEVAELRAKLQIVEGKASGACKEEINMKVRERIEILRSELEECQRIANDFVENEKRKMEERMWQQQREVEKLKWRLKEIETQFFTRSSTGDFGDHFSRRLMGSISATDDPGNMVKSMDLDMGDQEPFTHELLSASVGVAGNEIQGSKLSDNMRLGTVFEEEEAGECKESFEDEEVEKEIIEEKRVCSSTFASDCSPGMIYLEWCCDENLRDRLEHVNAGDVASSRHMRIENIFTLCGNSRAFTASNYSTNQNAGSGS